MKNNNTHDAKLPPQAIDLEEAVLGALMVEERSFGEVDEFLSPEIFYKEAHQKIYAAISRIGRNSDKIDILTVANELLKTDELKDVGGPYYIATLTNRIASGANIDFHCKILLQKFVARELIRTAGELLQEAWDDANANEDVFESINRAETKLSNITGKIIKSTYRQIEPISKEIIEKSIAIRTSGKEISGVPSGYKKLDEITGGWQNSDLIILAARPGMGKTALVLKFARNAALEFKKPVAVFSLEMSSIQLVARLQSQESGIPASVMLKTGLSDHDLTYLWQKISALEKAPIFIDDTPALSLYEFRAKARRLKREKKVELIIVDYLQLMNTGGEHRGNREQEISAISRGLKQVAKEMDIPIIALSQLSRAGEQRGGAKRPQLSDLRESGSIEQDADMVMFIYRPEYYNIETDEEGNSTKGMALIDIQKHRSGGLDDVWLRWVPHCTNFLDIEEVSENKNMQPNENFDKKEDEPF